MIGRVSTEKQGQRFDPDRKQRILEAAAHLIAERGVNSVRVADIAHRIGTTTGTVHYYFPFKDDVLNAAIEWAVEKAFLRQDEELKSHKSAKEKLINIVELQLPSDGQSKSEWSIWLQYWSEASIRAELQTEHKRLNSRWRSILVEIIEEGIKAGDFKNVDSKQYIDQFQALFNGLGIEVLVGASTVSHMRNTMNSYLKDSLFK
jgi:AcrR family transcriptional regulator